FGGGEENPLHEFKINANDPAASDYFGCAVSISGDYAIIGASGEDPGNVSNAGSAYIFHRSGDDWVQQAKISASDPGADDIFGVTISISGDYAIVGAWREDPGDVLNAGSAYIFHRSGDEWTQQAKINASDPGAWDYFGASVSIGGDYAIIGANWEDPGDVDAAGSAYIFHRSGEDWTQQAKINASDAGTSDLFGNSVSINGDYVIVGAYEKDHGDVNLAGSAYIFHRSGEEWTEQAKIIAGDAEAEDHFGCSVSINGDFAIVGAYRENPGGASNAGSAYIFCRSGENWTEQVKIIADDAEEEDCFGQSVSINGDYVIVGADLEDPRDANNAGSAYIFQRSGENWTQLAKINASDAEEVDNFGFSVSISGGYAIAGAHLEDPGDVNGAGSAYIYTGFMPSPEIFVEWSPEFGDPINWNQGFADVFNNVQYDVEFKAHNFGEATLLIDSLRFSDGIFSANADQMSIEPRQNQAFQVSLIVEESATYNDTLIVYSNDQANPVHRFPLVATSFEPPFFAVDPGSIERNANSGDMTEDTLTVSNNGAGALHFTVDHEMISDPNRDRAERTLRSAGSGGAPRRDAAGEVLYSVNSPFAAGQYKNLAYDHDNNWMWIQQYDAPYPVRALDIGNDFAVAAAWNNPQANPMDLAYCDGTIYAMHLWYPWVGRYDIDGNNLGNLNLNIDGSVNGIAIDPIEELLIAGSDNLRDIYSFDLSGNLIGVIRGVDQVLNYETWRSIEWVPFHTDGQLWINTIGNAWQIAIDTDRWEIIGGQAVQSFETHSTNYWDGLAHDFQDLWVSNYASATINVYDDGNAEVFPWLKYDPNEGNVEPDGSMEIYIYTDFINKIEGDYEANIIFNTNDPQAAQVSVNLLVHLSGTPDIDVEWSGDFGYPEGVSWNMGYQDVFINTDYTVGITIKNPGTSSLAVSNITSNVGAFSPDLTEFTVTPRQEQNVTLTFNGDSPSVYDGTLTISSNMEDYVIGLYAEAANPPVISVDPTSFSESVNMGGYESDRSFTISNTAEEGSSTLRFTIELEETRAGGRDVSRRILRSASGDNSGPQRDAAGDEIRTIQAPYSGNRGMAWDGEYMWAISSTGRRLYAVDLETSNVVGEYGTPYPFEGLAYDGEYLWAGYQEKTGDKPIYIYQYDRNGNQIDNYEVTAASYITFLGLAADRDNHLFVSMVLEGEGTMYLVSVFDINDLTEPIGEFELPGGGMLQGPPARDSEVVGSPEWGNITWVPMHHDGQLWINTFDSFGGETYAYQFYVDTAEWVTGQEPVQAFIWQSDNQLAGLAHDDQNLWHGNLGNDSWVSRDDGVNEGLGWLVLDPLNGEIAAQANAGIGLLFDGRNVLGGIYTALVHILTNDPETPDVVVDITLDVSGTPQISIQWPAVIGYPDSANWNAAHEYIYTGYPYDVEVEVRNVGSDKLTIDGITITGDDFSVTPTEFDLAIDEFQTLTVTFEAGEDGAHRDTMRVSSDDPENGEVQVILTGTTGQPPVIDINPESVFMELNIGAANEAGLTVTNNGASLLAFEIDVTEVSNPTRDRMARELRQVGGRSGSGAPRRDAPGEVLGELDSPWANCSGLAWDGELMWGVGTELGKLYALDTETGETVHDYRINSMSIYLAFDGEKLWSLSLNMEEMWYLVAYDLDGSILHELPFIPNENEISGFSADRNNHILVSGPDGMEIAVFDIDSLLAGGEPNPIGMIDISGGGGEGFPGRDGGLSGIGNFTWVPEHPDGQLWVNYNMGEGGYGVVQFYVAEDWTCDGEPVQMFEWQADDWMVGIAHDGENLWHGMYHDDVWMFYDDGIYEGLGWLFIDPISGEIDVEGNMAVTIYFDANDIYGGLYEADLHFKSNDPANSDVVVNVQLDVTGTPEIDATWSEEAGYPEEIVWNNVYDDVFTGYDSDIIITILSSGTDDLTVDSVRVDNDDYNVNPDQVAVIRPEHEAQITVTLNGAEDGAHNATLHVYSNAQENNHIQISLTAVSEPPPIIGVDPTYIRTYLQADESEGHVITVSNDGATELNWRTTQEVLEAPWQGGEPMPGRDLLSRVLRGVSKGGAPPSRDAAGDLIQELDIAFSMMTGLTYVDGLMWGLDHSNGRLFAVDLSDGSTVHNFEIHGYPYGLAFDGENFWVGMFEGGEMPTNEVTIYNMEGGTVDNFTLPVNGIIGLTSDEQGQIYVNACYFEGEVISYEGTYVFDKDSHNRIGQFNLYVPEGSGYDAFYQMTWVPEHRDGHLWVNTDVGQSEAQSAPHRDSDVFHLIQYDIDEGFNPQYVGQIDWFIESPAMGVAHDRHDMWLGGLASTLLYAYDDGLMEFVLGVDPSEGSINPDGTQDVTVTIDANGMPEGLYVTDLIFHSNDPETPEVRVEFQFRIGANAGLVVEPADPIDFGEVLIGEAAHASVVVSNIGNATLQLNPIQVNSDQETGFSSNLNEDNFNLEPNESRRVIINFSPDGEQEFTGQLHIECNDPDNGVFEIELAGIGITPPPDLFLSYLPDDNPGIGFDEHTIAENLDFACDVYVTDVDGDGDMDVLGAAQTADDIAWWENDGSENFTGHTIDGDFDGATSVYAMDLDCDGDIDVLGAAHYADDITWWENDGNENFTEHTIKGDFDGAYSVFATDVDRDGDIDVLGAAWYAHDITWWENDGSENFTEHTIRGDFTNASSVYATDVDSDGDIDVLGTAYNEGGSGLITWWENDGNENFTEHTIQGDFNAAVSVYATDVDGDGDTDVLGSSHAGIITWWENDGNENFTEHVITEEEGGAAKAYATDVDGDGDVDVLWAFQDANDIIWWENDGSENFTEHTINGDFDGARGVYATDVDGDGDVDVLGTALTTGEITWWENTQEFIWDFGQVEKDSSDTWTFRIYNHGSEPLDIEGVSSSNADVFTTDFGEATSVNSGEYYELTVTFTPNDFAEFNEYLEIYSSDPDEETVTVQLSGTGIFVNYDPEIVNEIPDYTLDEDFEPFIVADLDTVFEDPNPEDVLTYEVFNEVEEFTAVVINESQLQIDSNEDWFGQVEITVIADDGHGGDLEASSGRDSKNIRHLRRIKVSRVDDSPTAYNISENTDKMTTVNDETVVSFQSAAIGALSPNRDASAELTFIVTVEPLPAISVQPASVDFGDVYIGSMGSNTITIASVGNDTLHLTNVRVEGEGFTDNLDGETEFELPPDETRTFVINLIPDGEQEYNGELIIECDDPDNEIISVELFGYGLTPPPDIYLGYLPDDDPGIEFQVHAVDDNFEGAFSTYATDLDSDGDIDILGAGSVADDITWWENDGNQGFTETVIAGDYDGARAVYAIDVNGDNYVDVLGASGTTDDIRCWLNDGNQNFDEIVIAENFNDVYSIYAIDIDLDGDNDVLSAAYGLNDVAWFENEGDENFTIHTIDADFAGAWAVYADDVDGDGDIDIIGAAFAGDDISWWENDGDQNFTEHLVDGNYGGPRSVHTADMDGDGDVDLFSSSFGDDDITWWENDGSENFTERTIAGEFDGATYVYAADIDGDNDVDVLGASSVGDEVTWWENDGSQSFTEHNIVRSFDQALVVRAEDIDGDGDNDVLGAAFFSDDITWFENTQQFTWDFGEVEKDSSEIWTFRIYNYGSEPLNVEGVSSSNQDVFTSDFEGATNVAIGEYLELTVTFTPNDFAEFNEYLEIYSSDPDEETVTVQLSGVGIFINYPPIIVQQISDWEFDEDFEPQVVAVLDDIFSDPNGQDLTYEIISSSEHVSAVEAFGTQLVIGSNTANWFGTTTITIIADDGWGGERAPGQRDSGPVRQLRQVNKSTDSYLSASLLTNTTTGLNELVVGREERTLRGFNEDYASRDDETEMTFDVTVVPVNDPPEWVILPENNQAQVDEDQELRFAVEAEDVDGDNLTLSAEGELPEGWTLNDNEDGTGEFVWTPGYEDSGEYSLTIIATDDGEGSLTDEETITITVTNLNRAPVLDQIGAQEIAENEELVISPTASDPDNNGLIYS
ncbi:MAG: choice-of-anchor D domain-containing protein, partial [Calditrichaeota bacterium]|nr:choice-of-anchor D domain-containing protein [Calditrichota bacterium]